MRTFFVLLFLLAPAPSVAQENATITAEISAQTDSGIAVRLREILVALGDFEDVTVMSDDGVVTLRGTVTKSEDATRVEGLAQRIVGVVAVRNELTETAEIARRLDPAFERFQARIEQFITFLPIALIGIVVFVVINLAGLAFARLRQPWDRLAPNSFIAEIYRQIVRIAFGIGALVIALDIMNATALLSTILGAAGIIGLALGFAVRDTVENFIASVMLSIRQPFQPNDVIEINGDQGKVIRLTSRATILLSFDGNHIRVPNAIVFKSRLVNFSRHADRRFMFQLLVDRDCDLQAARALIEKTVQDLPFTLAEPAAQTWIEDINPAGVNMTVTGWVNQSATSIALAKGEAIRHVKAAMATASISLPDSSQAVILSRAKSDAPPPSESQVMAPVDTAADDALAKIIDAERHENRSGDLLSEDGRTE